MLCFLPTIKPTETPSAPALCRRAVHMATGKPQRELAVLHTKTFRSVLSGTMLTRSGLSILLSHLADSRGNRRAGLPTPGRHEACPVSSGPTTGIPAAHLPEAGESRKGQRRTKHSAICSDTHATPPALNKKAACSMEAGQERRRPAAGENSSGLFGSARLGVRWQRAQRCPHLPATCSLGVTWPSPSAPHICLRRPGVTATWAAQVCPFVPLLVHNWVCARRRAAHPPSPESCDGS